MVVSFFITIFAPLINKINQMEAIKTYTHGTTTLEIHTDENPMSPREWSNIGKMICHHNRYSLGDKHNINSKDYNSLDEMKKAIERIEDAAIMIPMYMYDHSGITIRTTPFSCPWDSGQIGYIIASRKKIREEYGVKRISKKLLETVKKVLEAEVVVYDQYVTGDTYGFKLFENGEETDSCWGFFGSDVKTNGMLDYIDNKELIEQIKEENNLVVSK